MYLKELYVEATGTLGRLHLEMPFNDAGFPKPLVIVGRNGGGKTTLLSVVADALFEASSPHHSDVVPNSGGVSRHWFRVSGSPTITSGASGSCAILRFDHQGSPMFYKEHAGIIPTAELRTRLPESLRLAVNWPDSDSPSKQFDITEISSRRIFSGGAYVFFPSSRAEVPSWLNVESVARDGFDLQARFSNELGKPIYVTRAFDKLKQWLLALLIDSRADFGLQVTPGVGNGVSALLSGNWQTALAPKAIWTSVNAILKTVMDDQTLSLGWTGRGSRSLVVHRNGTVVSPTIDAVSAGQSGLLSMFGTLLRYGDMGGAASAATVEGICLIDEVDAHMHVDLQNRALPWLVAMFPKVQFVLTSHSPLFALGMKKQFGDAGVLMVELPSGSPIQAEAFSEFGRALDVFRETTVFNDAIASAVASPGKMLVFTEGETDPRYLVAAAQLLGRSSLLDAVDFEWIGAKDGKGGQGFNTGKDALNSALSLYRAKPALLHRPILLLYDADANKPDLDIGQLHVRSMPVDVSNLRIRGGIENLLPPSAVGAEMFDTTVKENASGGSLTFVNLNKMRLCTAICQTRRNPDDFAGFAAALDVVAALLPVRVAAP